METLRALGRLSPARTHWFDGPIDLRNGAATGRILPQRLLKSL
jgi:hypothetical protein